MPWVKLSDNAVIERPFRALPRSMRLFYVELLSWSNRTGADGLIPVLELRRISDEPDPMGAVATFLEAGAMEPDPEQLGYRLVWWLDDQMTREQTEKLREAGRERAARSRDRLRLHRLGDHTECLPSWACRQRSAKPARAANAVPKASQRSGERVQRNGGTLVGGRVRGVQGSGDPTRPDPSSPDGEGEGGRAEAASPSLPEGSSAARPDGVPDDALFDGKAWWLFDNETSSSRRVWPPEGAS